MLAVAALSLLFYVVVAALTLPDQGPSSDAALTWAQPGPSRTVLCVQDGAPVRMTLAAQPTQGAKRALHANLLSTERRLPLGPVVLTLRDHTPASTVTVAGLELPWMKNSYAAGWPEIPAHLAWRVFETPRAGQAVHLALGALALLLALGLAGRLGGPFAAGICGLWLAADPWFHVYKRLLGGPEVVLQLAAIGGVALLVAAALRSSWRLLLLGALVFGVGVQVKPSFSGLVLGAVVAAPVVQRVWSRRAVGLAALVGAALLLGFTPTLAYWALDRAMPRVQEAAVGQEGAAMRVREVVDKLTPGKKSSREHMGFDPKRSSTLLDPLLDPASFWRKHWMLRGAQLDKVEPGRPPARTAGQWVGILASLGLIGMAAFAARRRGPGGERDEDEALRRRLVGGLAVLVVVTPFGLRLLNPDPHHLAILLPICAALLGSLLALKDDPRWRNAVLVVLVLASAGRLHALRLMNDAHVESAGRFAAVDGQRRVAAALLEEGAEAPAVLAYYGMSRLEAWTGGAVRPFLYTRASVSQQPRCVHGRDPRFLEQVVRAHRGGHLLLIASPGSGIPGAPDEYRSPAQIAEASRRTGIRIEELRRLEDDHGRWLATLYSVAGGPAHRR